MTTWTELRARSVRATSALLLLAASGCTPSVQGSVSPVGFSTVQRIVLLPFATPEGSPRALSESFADEMSSHLAGARFAVVDRATVVNTLTDREIRGSDLADPAVAARVGQAMGVDAVLIGRVATYHDQALSPDLDTSLAISVRIVDVHTREVILSTSSNATAAASFCSQEMSCLRGKVMSGIGQFIVEGADRPGAPSQTLKVPVGTLSP
jgi:curli biogenesis system outer membrane secretion channel CsgG